MKLKGEMRKFLEESNKPNLFIHNWNNIDIWCKKRMIFDNFPHFLITFLAALPPCRQCFLCTGSRQLGPGVQLSEFLGRTDGPWGPAVHFLGPNCPGLNWPSTRSITMVLRPLSGAVLSRTRLSQFALNPQRSKICAAILFQKLEKF